MFSGADHTQHVFGEKFKPGRKEHKKISILSKKTEKGTKNFEITQGLQDPKQAMIELLPQKNQSASEYDPHQHALDNMHSFPS